MKPNQQKYSIEEVIKWNDYLKNNHTLTETAEYYNIPYKSVVHLLNRYHFRTPCRNVMKIRRLNNEIIDYFKIIDSAEKAYYLGLIYSDGYICSSNYDRTKQVGIALQLQDKYILDNLHTILDLKTKISIYKNSAKLVITNLGMYQDLCNLGVVENKSNSDYIIPNIKPEFINSFILGYFDGDGCITIKKSGAIVVSICCNSYKFLESVQNYLNSQNIKTRLNKEMKSSGKYLYVLYLCGRKNQLKFKDLIYKNCNIFLTRKYDKFMKIPCKTECQQTQSV